MSGITAEEMRARDYQPGYQTPGRGLGIER